MGKYGLFCLPCSHYHPDYEKTNISAPACVQVINNHYCLYVIQLLLKPVVWAPYRTERSIQSVNYWDMSSGKYLGVLNSMERKVGLLKHL